MGLRMPQFGEAHAGELPEAFAALEGTGPEVSPDVAVSAARIEAGRRLIGKNGFGCISCHDLAGVPNSGTRGPDLASMNQRVRYEWYGRWLEQPQRVSPGTRMPMVFPDGKSLLPSVLNGSAAAQAEAMWAYLALGPALPLPEGLETPKGLALSVGERPVLLRTFLPEAGTRAVAVGYPGGVSVAFDAATCRLAYAWSGHFLDASPVWNNRGGAPARLLGQRFWAAPAGPSWLVTPSQQAPDFADKATDPAYGATPPEGQVFQGTRLLHFSGYEVDRSGLPTFRYLLTTAESSLVEIRERPEPLLSPVANGLARRFTLQLPAHHFAWLLAGETSLAPLLLDDEGIAKPVDLKSGAVEWITTRQRLVLSEAGGRPLVLEAIQPADGARWLLRRRGTGWQVLVRLSSLPEAGKVQVTLRIWAPYREDATLLNDMLREKK
jgi:hypothetical protein